MVIRAFLLSPSPLSYLRLSFMPSDLTLRRMRIPLAWILAALCLVIGSAPAQAAPPHVQRASFANRGYLPLSDWAKALGLELRWLKRDGTVQVSRGPTKFVLTIDSRQAEVNGVEIWLSHAPVAQNGVVLVATLDLETALKPLLF